MIQSGVFSRFSQPAHFSRFKPDDLLLSTARFTGYNLEKFRGQPNLEKSVRLDHFTGTDKFPNCVRWESRLEHINNPIMAMGFLAMFTFQLDNTKR